MHVSLIFSSRVKSDKVCDPTPPAFLAARSAQELCHPIMNHKDYKFKFQNRAKGWGKILMLSLSEDSC